MRIRPVGISLKKLGGRLYPVLFRPILIPIRSRLHTRTGYWCWGYPSGKMPNPDALKLPKTSGTLS